MEDRSFRNLSRLQESSSSSRVFNLYYLWKRYDERLDVNRAPIFENKFLNQSIIVKHTLRADERHFFDGKVTTATKIIIPIDLHELKAGGRYLFVGQKDFDKVLKNTLGDKLASDCRDRVILEVLNAAPSLDPFLLKESLARIGIKASPEYFDVSKADSAQMRAFAQKEIAGLINVSFAQSASLTAYAERLVSKIMSIKSDEQLEPLRQTLRLQHDEFEDGLFSWKAFLFYKWTKSNTLNDVRNLMNGIKNVTPIGHINHENRVYIEKSRLGLCTRVVNTMTEILSILKIYDDAYEQLVKNANPRAFREFLLSAPGLFHTLGAQLGVINHLSSYWNYRFPEGKVNAKVPIGDLLDLFADFQRSLGLTMVDEAMFW